MRQRRTRYRRRVANWKPVEEQAAPPTQGQRPKYCPQHPQEQMFEELVNTPHGQRIKQNCLTCIAETELPQRLQLYERERANAHTLRTWLRNLLAAWLRNLLAGIVPVFWGVVLTALPLHIYLGLSVTAVIVLWAVTVVLFQIALVGKEHYDFLKAPKPTLESVKASLAWRANAAARGMETFRNRLYAQYLAEATGIQDVDNMTGVAFEATVARLFEFQGFAVERTPNTGDLGVDLLAGKKQDRIAVQCKRRLASDPVGPGAVQEVFTGKNFYRCEKAMVVTNSYFSEQTQSMARRLGVELRDREWLLQELLKGQTKLSWEEYLARYYV